MDIDWNYYEEKFLPMMEKQIEKLSFSREIFYEAYIDLEEEIEHWWNYIKKYPQLAAHNLAKRVINFDRWYGTDAYIKSLDEMIKGKPIIQFY